MTRDEKEKTRARRILESMIKLKAYFGIEAGMGNIDADTRKKILDMLREMDTELADRIEKNNAK